MGSVTFIDDWKKEHPDDPDTSSRGNEGRLEEAVKRLDTVLRQVGSHPAGMASVESELLAITGAVSLGLFDDAARRAERLADRLTERSRKGG